MALTERYVTATGTDTYANSTNPATPMSLATAISNAAAGDRINIKKGTYTLAGNFNPTNAGTVVSPIIWRGYNTTIGDLDFSLLSKSTLQIDTANYPTIDSSAFFSCTFTNFNIIQSLNFTGLVNGRVVTLGSSSLCLLCKITSTGNSSNSAACAASTGSMFLACEMQQTNTGSSAFAALYSAASSTYALYCHIHAKNTNTNGSAVDLENTGCVLIGCIIISDSKDGVRNNTTTPYNLIVNCTIYAPNGDCVQITNVAATTGLWIINCMMTDSSRSYENKNSGTSVRPVFRIYNRTRDNANADVGAGDWPIYGAVTTDTGDSTSDFLATLVGGGTDYRLLATSAAKAAGLPGYTDIGALQRQEPTSGLVLPHIFNS